MPRPKRLGLVDPTQELADLKTARAALVRVCRAYAITGPEYRSAGRAIEDIDEIADLLAGRPGRQERLVADCLQSDIRQNRV